MAQESKNIDANRQTALISWAKVLPCDNFDLSMLRSQHRAIETVPRSNVCSWNKNCLSVILQSELKNYAVNKDSKTSLYYNNDNYTMPKDYSTTSKKQKVLTYVDNKKVDFVLCKGLQGCSLCLLVVEALSLFVLPLVLAPVKSYLLFFWAECLTDLQNDSFT